MNSTNSINNIDNYNNINNININNNQFKNQLQLQLQFNSNFNSTSHTYQDSDLLDMESSPALIIPSNYITTTYHSNQPQQSMNNTTSQSLNSNQNSVNPQSIQPNSATQPYALFGKYNQYYNQQPNQQLTQQLTQPSTQQTNQSTDRRQSSVTSIPPPQQVNYTPNATNFPYQYNHVTATNSTTTPAYTWKYPNSAQLSSSSHSSLSYPHQQQQQQYQHQNYQQQQQQDYYDSSDHGNSFSSYSTLPTEVSQDSSNMKILQYNNNYQSQDSRAFIPPLPEVHYSAQQSQLDPYSQQLGRSPYQEQQHTLHPHQDPLFQQYPNYGYHQVYQQQQQQQQQQQHPQQQQQHGYITNSYNYTPQPVSIPYQDIVTKKQPVTKRSFDETNDNTENTKKSTIAGVVYNSTAVFKRLKPSVHDEKSETVYKMESHRSQGRPFSSNLTGRFIYHDSLKSLLGQVDKKNNNRFVVYHMNDESKFIKDKNATIDLQLNLKSGDEITDLQYACLRGNTIHNSPDSPEISIDSLDTFLGCKHSDILKVEGYREQFNTIQKIIKYNPKKEEKINNKDENSILSSSSSSSLKNKFNFHKLIRENFGIEKYVFVKTIRDNNGHILKLETIKPPVDKNGNFNYTPEWLKRRICYPRYKGGMNLHILSADFNFILYNDLKMLLWDIKEELISRYEEIDDQNSQLSDSSTNNSDKLPQNKDEIDTTVIVDRALKRKLFGNKIVYTQTLDR